MTMAFRSIEPYLSRKAQSRLHLGALVFHERDGSFTLERPGHKPLGLGLTFSIAQQALQQLVRAVTSRPEIPG